jgi:hypothetical protein
MNMFGVPKYTVNSGEERRRPEFGRRRCSDESPAMGEFSVALARRGEAPDKTNSIRQAMRSQRIGRQRSASGGGCAQASEAAAGRCTRQGGGGVRARGTPWLALIRSRACGCDMAWHARQEWRRCCPCRPCPSVARWAPLGRSVLGWAHGLGPVQKDRISFLFWETISCVNKN